jgi:hypothetical protein
VNLSFVELRFQPRHAILGFFQFMPGNRQVLRAGSLFEQIQLLPARFGRGRGGFVGGFQVGELLLCECRHASFQAALVGRLGVGPTIFRGGE